MRRSRESRAKRGRGKTNENNDLHSFRDTCRRCIVVLPSYSVAGVGKLVGLSRDPELGLPCSNKHLRCYLCCARRLATSQAFAPAYRRSTSSVSSATLAVLGCRVASSPSDEEDCCLWISALRLPSSALPYVTVVAAYSMAARGLFRNARGPTTWVATQVACRLAEP